MERFIILRKHLLVSSYVVIKDDVSKSELIDTIAKIPSPDLVQYKFIKGTFIKPTINYKSESLSKDTIIVDDVDEEPKDKNLARKIFEKYSQGNLFSEQNNQGAVWNYS